MRALILTAGLGERLRPLTLKRAKPAIEFLNMPMLAFPYYWLERLQLSEVVFNTHYLPETVRHAAMEVVSPEIQLHITFENMILGSGGGIWNARLYLQGETDFAVANGDAVVAFAREDVLPRMLAAHRRGDALATLLVCPLEGIGTKIPGVWRDAQGRVVHFGKKTAQRNSLECLHYASFMFLNERVWRYLPEGSSNILYDVLATGMSQGETVLAFEERDMHWFETGNIEDYLRATHDCLKFLRDSNSAYGRNLRDMLNRFTPEYELFSDLAKCHLNAQAPLAHQEGFCVVGHDARIDERVTLENAVILPGAEVRASVKDQVVI